MDRSVLFQIFIKYKTLLSSEVPCVLFNFSYFLPFLDNERIFNLHRGTYLVSGRDSYDLRQWPEPLSHKVYPDS